MKVKMEFNNKTVVICGLIMLGLLALVYRYDELALAIGSGLVGYLSKDASIQINKTSSDEENDIP